MEPYQPADDRMGLSEYVRALRRRWFIVGFTTLFLVGAVAGFSLLQTPRYSASADVLIQPTFTGITGPTEVSEGELATQVQVVGSLPIAQGVAEKLGMEETPSLAGLVSVEPVGSSRIIRISARDADPEKAAQLANAVAAVFVEYRRAETSSMYAETATQLSERQSAVEARIAEIDELLGDDPDDRVELEAERRVLQTELGQLSSQIAQSGGGLSVPDGGGSLLQEATIPTSAVSPRPVFNAVLAAGFGLMLGVALALLRDRFDDAVRDEDSARQAMDGVPVLGRIPEWDDEANRDRLITVLEPFAPATEAFQTLGVNLRFLLATRVGDERRGGILLTTSAQPGEGKTVTSSNLAVAACRIGMRVALVDADLRRGKVGERFGLGDPRGLSDLLVRFDDPSNYLVDVGVDNLRVLPAGTVPPNPTQMLGSNRLQTVLTHLAGEFDLVILDSPPVLAVADSLELAARADQVIVVTRAKVSRRRMLSQTVETLRQVGVTSMGGVINGVPAGDVSVSRYGYTPRRYEDGSGGDQNGSGGHENGSASHHNGSANGAANGAAKHGRVRGARARRRDLIAIPGEAEDPR